MLLKLAYRNLARRAVHTGVTLIAIAIGVAGLILSGGFVQNIIMQLGEVFIGSQTGHIQIAKEQYFQASNQSLSEILMPEVDSLRKRAAAIPGVEEIMGRLTFSGTLNNGHRDYAVIVQGVEPEKERKLGVHITMLQGHDLDTTDEFGALLGEGLAASLDLKVGDHAVLLASTEDGALNTLDIDVKGIFRSFSKDFDARALRITLPAAQSLLMTDQLNVLVLRLDKTDHTNRVAAKLRQKINDPGIVIETWQVLSDYYTKTVELYKRQFGVLQLIILCMVFLSVVNSINMSAYERTAEFGTMRALGSEEREVGRLIFIECILLGIIGASLGMVLGIVCGLLVSAIGIPMPPAPGSELEYVAQINLALSSILISGCIGFVAAVIAALPPTMRSKQISITDALRRSI